MGMSADHSPSSSVVRHNPDPDEIIRRGQETSKLRDVLDRLMEQIAERAKLRREPMKVVESKRGKKHRHTIDNVTKQNAAAAALS
jgi:hypothetical protein